MHSVTPCGSVPSTFCLVPCLQGSGQSSFKNTPVGAVQTVLHFLVHKFYRLQMVDLWTVRWTKRFHQNGNIPLSLCSNGWTSISTSLLTSHSSSHDHHHHLEKNIITDFSCLWEETFLSLSPDPLCPTIHKQWAPSWQGLLIDYWLICHPNITVSPSYDVLHSDGIIMFTVCVVLGAIIWQHMNLWCWWNHILMFSCSNWLFT